MTTDCSDVADGAWILVVIASITGFVIGWLMCKSEMLEKQLNDSRGEDNTGASGGKEQK
jgi:hypothetical protein